MPYLDNLLLDVRYALRVLLKSPAFTSAAAVTLMLGIGANIFVLAVLNSVLLHPLDVSHPEALYQLRHKAWMSGRLLTTSYPAFHDFRQRNTAFSDMAGIYGYSVGKLSWNNSAVSVHGDEVTGNYFDLLGVPPEVGRLFHQADEHGPGSVPYLVLSNELWRIAFNADRNVIGKTVDLNKRPFVVIGVAPSKFHGTERFVWPDYWIPMLNQQQDYLNSRTAIMLTVVGRLKPRVTPKQATENLNAIAAQLAREYPKTDDGLPLRLIHPGLWGDNGDVIRGFLWSVTVLALLVLVAACANLASLFAARASDRSRELAVRVALGSSRGRLAKELLTEAVLLSLLGGAAGLLGSSVLLSLLNRWPRAAEVHLSANLDVRVYLTGLALTLLSAMLFGIVPARQAWNSSPLQAMKSGSANPHPRRFALRDLLLGAQIAICTLLLTATLVAVRGLDRALQSPLGFQPRGAILADLDLGKAADAALEKKIIEAMCSLPGVVAVGSVNRTPMTGGIHGTPVFLPGTTEFKLKNSVLSPYAFQVSPGYLEAAKTHLLNGRDVSWHDTATTPHVAIVNQTFADKMWGKTQVLGRSFIIAGNLTQVIGLAADGKYHDLEESPQPAVYLPLSQSNQSETVFVIRSQLPPNDMAPALRHVLTAIQPDRPFSLRNWSDDLDAELFPARAATVALGVMGLLAAMLAVTGIFGMAAYSVSRRMKELGIRAALGASKTHVITAAVGRPALLLAMGLVLGLLLSISASRFLAQIVYQANPKDPLVLAGTVLSMLILGISASAIPAARALAVDPAKLMRED